MESSVTELAKLYAFNTGFYQKALNVFSPEEVLIRPEGKANSVNWVAGHMATSRIGVLNSLGQEEKDPWDELYEFGAEVKEDSAYPPLELIKQVWDDASAKLSTRFPRITLEQLEGVPPFEPPGMEKSLRGYLYFMYMHETYHLGHLGYLGRLFGHGRLFG